MSDRSEQWKRLKPILSNRQNFAGTAEWFEAILTLLLAGTRLEEDTQSALERTLRGCYGEEYLKIGDDLPDHLRFWKAMAEEFTGNSKVQAIYADTLLLGGRHEEAMDAFLAVFDRDPLMVYHVGGEIGEFMEQFGGERWFRYRLNLVRAARLDGDDDIMREHADELMSEYKNDANALQRISKAMTE
jgi:hypothetical protein